MKTNRSSSAAVLSGGPAAVLPAEPSVEVGATGGAPCAALLRATLDALTEGVLWLDETGTVRYINAAAARLLGTAPEDIMGGNFRHRGERWAEQWALLNAAAGVPVQSRWLREDGISLSLSERLIAAGDCVFDCVSLLDVTERDRVEEALRLSNEDRALVVRNSPVGIVTGTPDGRFVSVNESFCRMLGYSEQELLARTWLAVTHPDDRAYSRVHFTSVAAGVVRHAEYEKRYVRKDGRVVDAIVRTRLIRGADGTPRFLMGTIEDVTERKRAEQALRTSEKRFRRAVVDAPFPVMIHGADGEILQVNTAWLEQTGYAREDLLFLEDWIALAHGGQAGPELSRVYEAAGEAAPCAIRRRDGEQRTWVLRSSPLDDMAEGRRVFITMAVDITDRERAEQALRRSETSLARAQRVARLGTWERDLVAGTLEWSEEVFRIFGVSPGSFVPSPEEFHKLVHPGDRASLQQAFRRAVEGGATYVHDHRILRPDGSERYVSERAEIVRNAEGRPVRAIGTVQDITEFRLLEEQFRQSQKMEAIGRLAGGVAHDFNNLLTIINGYSRILLESMAAEDPSAEILQEIANAGERAAGLTRQLLAFSRRQVLQPQAVDLNGAVRDVEKMLRRLIGEDIHVQTVLRDNVGHVHADPSQLQQVILNLAVNARDAMPSGGRLSIMTALVEPDMIFRTTHPGLRNGPCVLLAVSDTGCGMTDDVRKRIFEPFFTTKQQGKGTGLGLSMVYGIVQQSDGVIDVQSRPGAGTTFYIYLPRIEAPVAAGDTRKFAPVAGAGRVLIVEDQAELRRLAALVLRSAGYTVNEAADGPQALDLIGNSEPFDLLLTDVVMPHMSGKELAERLRAQQPGVRVIFMSGYTDHSPADFGVGEPNVSFIHKPFTPEQLQTAVSSAMS